MKHQEVFLSDYNISKEDYNSTGLIWLDLTKIYNDYLNYREQLEQSAIYIFNSLMKAAKVHSVRYRIKNPEHVIEKIIRKKIANQDSNITIENYKEELHDLIGLRALHLFKDEWTNIDTYIRNTWNLKQKPIANFRKGDSELLIKIFKDAECETREHKYGYRSVHYIIETQPGKQRHIAEIQVRTIFEEAWSEIDHTVRYPYDMENPLFSQFLSILNRLAGGADEMGAFIKFLQKDLARRDGEFNQELKLKDKLITELEQKIEKLNLKEEQLNDVKSDLEKLRNSETPLKDYDRRRRKMSEFLSRPVDISDNALGEYLQLHKKIATELSRKNDQ